MKRSKFLSLNTADFLKGLLLAVLMAITTGVYQLITSGTILTWETFKPVLLSGLAAGLLYLTKNLFTNSQGEILKAEPGEPETKTFKKNPATKIILIGVILSGLTLSSSAQLTFKGFFKPVKQGEFYGKFKAVDPTLLGDEKTWILRPAVSITSLKYIKNSETKLIEVSPYVASGLGFGFQHYVESDGSPYNNYGFNILMLFNTIPLTSEAQSTGAGISLAGTFGFMKLIDIGLGYDFSAKQLFAMSGIKYNF